MRALKKALLAAACVLLLPAPARAAQCNRPDVIDTLPPNEAVDVPIDAKLSARYVTAAEYLGEAVTLEHVGMDERSVNVEFDLAEGILSFRPEVPLVPGDEYVVRWPGLRGLSTASIGRGKDVRFTAGTGPDLEQPSFEGLIGIDWSMDRGHDECSDTLEERYVFELDLGSASDDGGRDSLALRVFQTRGPHLDENSREPVLVSRIPNEGQKVRVARTTDKATGPVCFAASTHDLTDKLSAGAEKEVCVETVKPPFFEGCSTTLGQRAQHAGVNAVFALALALLVNIGRLRARRQPLEP